MKKRDYRDYLQDMLDSINDVDSFTKGMSFEQFKKDRKTVNAVVRSIEVIGEASKRVPRTMKAKYAGVPWKLMAGMRDKLIREYFGVDAEILWKTTKEDIPPLKPLIQKMLNTLEE
jgi:uncharacterized protein with HEPN domain